MPGCRSESGARLERAATAWVATELRKSQRGDEAAAPPF